MSTAFQPAALRRRFLVYIIGLSSALFVTACQTPFGPLPTGQTEQSETTEQTDQTVKKDQTAQSEQTTQTAATGEANQTAGTEETARQPSFNQFSDIPIPEGANMDLDQTLILGNQDGWIGRLSLKSRHSMAMMYNFYEREMARFGWSQITVVRTSISTMTYSRGQRIATITLQPGTLSSGVTIDFTVAPTNNPKN